MQPPTWTEVVDALGFLKNHAGWGWTLLLIFVGLTIGLSLWFYRKKYLPLKRRSDSGASEVGMKVFPDRSALTKSVGTLDDELKDAERVWAIWPCGTAIPGLRSTTIKKIERAILTDIIRPCDFAPYSRMLTVGSYPFRMNLYNATKKIADNGGKVVWHRHPTTSTVIVNPKGSNGWARTELLIPYAQAAERPSVRVSRVDNPEHFDTIVSAFEEMWKYSVAPKFEEVSIPAGGPIFVETSAIAAGHPQTPTPISPKSLVIHSAKYGCEPNEFADVTEAVRNHVAGNRLDMIVENRLFGDPAKGKKKVLEVRYSVGQKPEKTVTVQERDRLTIPVKGD